MKKIVFDNSIHLGQFAINNEEMRISSKNSQAMLSNKSDQEIVGIESFNENTYSDDIIWGLDRITQDTFYPFMDMYHSVKNITRIPLNREDSEIALKIAQEFNIALSNALTCAIAINYKANEIHSWYSDFKNKNLIQFLESFNISINKLNHKIENKFDEPLETLYQNALQRFKHIQCDPVIMFHR